MKKQLLLLLLGVFCNSVTGETKVLPSEMTPSSNMTEYQIMNAYKEAVESAQSFLDDVTWNETTQAYKNYEKLLKAAKSYIKKTNLKKENKSFPRTRRGKKNRLEKLKAYANFFINETNAKFALQSTDLFIKNSSNYKSLKKNNNEFNKTIKNMIYKDLKITTTSTSTASRNERGAIIVDDEDDD